MPAVRQMPDVLGSYSFNGVWGGRPNFREEDLKHPPNDVPYLVDGIYTFVLPFPTDKPATDLFAGTRPNTSSSVDPYALTGNNLPRHGNRPRSIPRNWPEDKPLPGAVNVGFFDGHVSLTKLDNLWNLSWYPGYQPLSKRPGLP